MIALADLKAWLGVTDTASDDALTALEARQVATVSTRLDRYFGEPEEVTEILDGYRSAIWLSEPPIDGTLTLYTRTGLGETWTLGATADYEVDGRQILRREAAIWPVGSRTVRATYQRGYAAGEAPGDVVQVVLELCARAWESRGNSATQREKLGPLEIEYRPLKDIPDPIDTLVAWRRVRAA